jgi:Cation efflux family
MNDFARSVSRETETAKGRTLEYFTLGWNLTEAVVGISAGFMAGSIALVGFGVDSVIEGFSGASLLWRLQSAEADEKREQLALRLVGISFFVLAAYVATDAVKTLIQREPPDASIVGICLAAISLAVMPLLARAKRRVAARLNSCALVADSRRQIFAHIYQVSCLLDLFSTPSLDGGGQIQSRRFLWFQLLHEKALRRLEAKSVANASNEIRTNSPRTLYKIYLA